MKWFNRLASARNFIAHIGAFYLALDTTEPAWDLLLVKGNIKQFDDPRTYVRFSSVMEIMDGLDEVVCFSMTEAIVCRWRRIA
ncbi:hypothetical protein [Paraburkholderia sp. MM5477-R1]|uniref:hypothetical protein n=1 Tax=Paraburkholderia sp. MM5477-R1 TaxID=2991062 RepID=UPI003D24A1DE